METNVTKNDEERDTTAVEIAERLETFEEAMDRLYWTRGLWNNFKPV